MSARSRPGTVSAEIEAVYLDYYHLKEMPFDITPNPRFMFFSPQHREAYNHLMYGIRERKGFVQLTGEVGAGKTTLCRTMMEHLDQTFATALILNPALSPEQLVKAIALEFGLAVRNLDGVETLEQLNLFLLRLAEDGRDAVLIIDEAQDLTDEGLEQVRLLSNLELDHRKLIQIVLMGQPELRDRLNNPALRQLRQRITVRYHLQALSSHETAHYIKHRLKVSGATRCPQFTRLALWRVQSYSQGVPRLVNALCDKALLAGFVNRRSEIDYRTIGVAIQELEGTF